MIEFREITIRKNGIPLKRYFTKNDNWKDDLEDDEYDMVEKEVNIFKFFKEELKYFMNVFIRALKIASLFIIYYYALIGFCLTIGVSLGNTSLDKQFLKMMAFFTMIVFALSIILNYLICPMKKAIYCFYEHMTLFMVYFTTLKYLIYNDLELFFMTILFKLLIICTVIFIIMCLIKIYKYYKKSITVEYFVDEDFIPSENKAYLKK